MKRILFLILIFLFFTKTTAGIRISATFRNQPLPEVLSEIERLAEGEISINFAYDQIENYLVSLTLENVTPIEAVREAVFLYPIKIVENENIITVQAMPDRMENFIDSLRQINPDTLREIILKNVTVEERIIPAGDHVILILSKENRSFGTNALDAISSMQFFITNLNERELLSWDRQKVFILINGVPSSGMDLRAYKGEDIKSVKYYNVAPPQYMSMTKGPVIDVIVKKRHDHLYSGYFSASNAVNTGFGTNQATLSYSDSLNIFRINSWSDYRNISGIDKRMEVRYGNGKRSCYLGDKTYKGSYTNTSLMYQRFQGRHLFNATLSFIIDPGEEMETRTGEIYSNKQNNVGSGAGPSTPWSNLSNENYFGRGENSMKSYAETYSLSLYYDYRLKNNSQFALNVVNTLGSSYSRAAQSLTSVDVFNYFDYGEFSKIDNRTYSFIASATYTGMALGGKYSVNSRYEYKQLRQKYETEEFRPSTQKGYLGAGMSWLIDQKTVYPAVGLNYIEHRSASVLTQTLLPYFRLYADVWGKGRMKGASVQFTSTTQTVAPSLGQLTTSATIHDPWLLSVGNPKLRNYWQMKNNLAFVYFPPKSKNSAQLSIYQNYARRPFVSTIVRDNGRYFILPQTIDDIFQLNFYFRCSWNPVKWLEISPYFENLYSSFETPNQSVRFRYSRIGGSVVIRHKQLSLLYAINSPTKEYDGDILSRGSLQSAIIAQYKTGNWSFGAQWNLLGRNDYTMAEFPIKPDVGDASLSPTFRYFDNSNWYPLHNLIRLNFTYNFSVGRSRRHANAVLNESSKDTGLSKFNSVKMEY